MSVGKRRCLVWHCQQPNRLLPQPPPLSAKPTHRRHITTVAHGNHRPQRLSTANSHHRQQRPWHTRHVTNLTRRPWQQQCFPPPPYGLPTTTAHPAPNLATPCHQPSPPPHQQRLQPRPQPRPHRQQHPHHQMITSNEERPRLHSQTTHHRPHRPTTNTHERRPQCHVHAPPPPTNHNKCPPAPLTVTTTQCHPRAPTMTMIDKWRPAPHHH